MKNQTITRDNLAKIYKISCDGWKAKIAALSIEQTGDKITITPSLAKEMFAAADDSQKKILSKIIKMPESPISKVKSYEDALKLTGDKCTINETDTSDEIGQKKLKAIIKALNGGRMIDKAYAMSNTYYVNLIYFDRTGLARVHSLNRVARANSNFGFRLCFYDRESAEYAARTFVDLYEQTYAS